jgi:hypothetical protein
MRDKRLISIYSVSNRTYSAWRTSWCSAKTDVDHVLENIVVRTCWDAAYALAK